MTQADFARIWHKLTDNQRLYLINATVPREQRVPQSQTIMAMKALGRRELMIEKYGNWTIKPEARELIAWTIEHGYANYTDGSWEFTAPELAPRYKRKIDIAELAKLAADGYYAAEIARRLGVTREAVRQAARRAGIALPPRGGVAS